MQPEGRDLGSLWDMLAASRNIKDFIGDITEEHFRRDNKTHFAVISQLQIIGEAAKRLSPGFRKEYPVIPWKQIAGMRDFLVHAYDEVDLGRVWTAATVSVPALAAFINPVLPPGKEDNLNL